MTVEEIKKFVDSCDNKGILDEIKYACQNKLTELLNNDNSEDKLSFCIHYLGSADEIDFDITSLGDSLESYIEENFYVHRYETIQFDEILTRIQEDYGCGYKKYDQDIKDILSDLVEEIKLGYNSVTWYW